MKSDGITIEVKCGISVDRSTAEACLKIVEIYVNSSSKTLVQATKNNDGTHSFCFTDTKI